MTTNMSHDAKNIFHRYVSWCEKYMCHDAICPWGEESANPPAPIREQGNLHIMHYTDTNTNKNTNTNENANTNTDANTDAETDANTDTNTGGFIGYKYTNIVI